MDTLLSLSFNTQPESRPNLGRYLVLLSRNKQEIAGCKVFKAADGALSYASVLKVVMMGEAAFYTEAKIQETMYITLQQS